MVRARTNQLAMMRERKRVIGNVGKKLQRGPGRSMEGKESKMTGHDRLEAVLFGNPERRLIDVKFFVPHGKGITPDMIFNEAASGFEQVDQGKVVGDSDFKEHFEQIELAGLFA